MSRFILLVFAFIHAGIAAAAALKLACVGDSITQGAGLSNPRTESYPARLQVLLGDDWAVKNFGLSGRTMQKAGDHPYWREKAFAEAQAYAPDVVTIKLGTNDSKPHNWNAARYEADAREMIATFQKLPSHPRVLVCLPVPVFKADQWGIRAAVVEKEVLPILRKVAHETGAELVNLHTPCLDDAAFYPDTVHPNADGHAHLAQILAAYLKRPADTAYTIAPKIPADAKVSSFHGYTQWRFKLDGRDTRVVAPRRVAAGRPRAWRMEFFDHEPQTDLALLEAGYHLVFIDTFGSCGGAPAVPHWEKLDAFCRDAGLAPRAALIGLSRGGLYAYNWALAHPDRVTAIYADAPVLDIRSWPGPGRAKEWGEALAAYGLTAETVKDWRGPIDRCEALAKAGIPLLHVVGDADTVVPVKDNTARLEARYRELGGAITVIHKPGVEHHPHSLKNPQPIVDFLLAAENRPVPAP